MGTNVVDMIGKVCGRLTVIKRADNHITSKGKKLAQWLCVCNCKELEPNYIVVKGVSLRNGNTKSCGCFKSERTSERSRKYNRYDLTGEYGIGYTFKDEPFFFDVDGYVGTTNKGKHLFLHRLVMDVSREQTTDHIFHILYDDRKSQLRIVSLSQNQMNRSIAKNNTSGVTGVCFSNKDQRWIGSIGINNKNAESKQFLHKNDAIAYRKLLEIKYFGEYATKEDITTK